MLQKCLIYLLKLQLLKVYSFAGMLGNWLDLPAIWQVSFEALNAESGPP